MHKTKIATISLLVISALFLGFSSNPPGLTGAPDEGNCTQCHASVGLNLSDGSISLASSGGLYYEANTTYDMTLTMRRTNAHVFGFSLCCLDTALEDAGQLIATETNSDVEDFGRAYLSHRFARNTENMGEDSVIRNFEWTSPDTTTGPITFYFCGNFVDTTQGTIDGGVFNDSLVLLPISQFNGTPDFSINKTSVFPNPCTDVLHVTSLKPQLYTLHDSNGKAVRLGSTKQTKISIDKLPAGAYFVRLDDGNTHHIIKSE